MKDDSKRAAHCGGPFGVIRGVGGLRGGIISRENFVFKGGGENFPRRNLGVSAVQRRCWSLGIPKGGKIPSPKFPAAKYSLYNPRPPPPPKGPALGLLLREPRRCRRGGGGEVWQKSSNMPPPPHPQPFLYTGGAQGHCPTPYSCV